MTPEDLRTLIEGVALPARKAENRPQQDDSFAISREDLE
jgi:hypothetical protein